LRSKKGLNGNNDENDEMIEYVKMLECMNAKMREWVRGVKVFFL